MVTGFATLQPSSVEELSEALRESGPFFITGAGTKSHFLLPTQQSDAMQVDALEGLGSKGYQLTGIAKEMLERMRSKGPSPWVRLCTENLSGVVEHDHADQVVVVRAGTTVEELQEELGKKGQCIPLPRLDEVGPLVAGLPGTVGGTISMNLPHALEPAVGSWREWVLGMTIVRANGEVAKSGSKAVKNVAGYDIQKLMIGSRGTLGVMVEVILKTYPLGALPRPKASIKKQWSKESVWIQRTLRSDFPKLLVAAAKNVLAYDMESCTLWAALKADEELPRFDHDWVIRSGAGEKNLRITDPTLVDLMVKAKDIFDPERKLNPGEMGFF